MDETTQELEETRLQDMRAIIVATLTLFCFLLGLALDDPRFQNRGEEPIGRVIPDGTVRHRPSRTLEWNSFNREFPVYARDSIFTPEGSSASVILASGTIELKPNSLVKLVGLQNSDLQLVMGNSAANQDTWSNMMLACGPRPVSDLSGPELAQLPTLPPISPRRMPPPMPAPPRLLALDSLDYFRLRLTWPFPGAKLPRKSLWVGFSWSSIPIKEVRYELEVSREPEFKTFIGNENARIGQRLLLNLPGKYYARVRASLGDKSIVSETNAFSMVNIKSKRLFQAK